MATAEQYAEWIVANQDKKGTPEFETVAAAYKEVRAQATQEAPEEKGMIENYIDNASIKNVPQNLANLGAGLVRGAGSIGATILAPADMINDAIDGKGLSLESNRKRRADMDAAFETMGVDTDSVGYAGGKLTGEIAGTAGLPVAVGGQVAKVAPKLGSSIASGGFKLGSTTGNALKDTALRTAGGAVSGGAMAGAVNPEDATTGAMVGAVIPNAVKGVGKLGAKMGERAANKAKLLAGRQQQFQAAKDAKSLGYVIPPADLNPGKVSELASGASGKIKTAQFASQRNQLVTNNLVKKSLGLTDDTPLNEVVLNDIRKKAGDAYASVADIGMVQPSPKYAQDLDDAVKPFLREAKSFPNRKPNPIIDDIQSLKTDSFDAGDAIETIKVLRSEADKAYRGGDNLAGKAYKKAASSLEDAIDAQLVKNNAPADVLEAYRGARKTIAKTYTVENALNAQTGNIDASKLAKELGRKKPLDGELLQVAKIAEAFPKATQMLKEAPKAVSPLDYYGSTALAVGSGNVLPLAMVGARPALRNVLLSKPVQNKAINSLNKAASTNGTGKAIEKAANSRLIEYLSRGAPVAAAQ